MVFKYGSDDFEILREVLLTFFSKPEYFSNLDIKTQSILNIFCEVLDKDNIATLKNLDNKNLMFNSWKTPNDACQGYLLSYQNSMLHEIYREKSTAGMGAINVIESLFLVFYADFYEASYILDSEPTREYFNQISKNLHFNSEELSSETLKRMSYLWIDIPRNVFTVHVNQHLDKTVLDTVNKLQSNNDYINKNLNLSNSLKKDIEIIQNSLDEQKSEYNFVGLSKGFTLLKDNKVTELKSESSVYNWLMGIIITLIIAKSIWSAYYLNVNDINSPMFIIITISTLLFLFILLYFFRISLVNVKSIKSQILQIDLRLTLCQFIHNYDSDTKDLREGMKESFGKFESVIFSPLVATEDQMPSTFDGLEQLTGMIGLFNKKSD